MLRFRYYCTACVLLLGWQTGPTLAADVTVWTIRATHSKAQISPELKPLAKALTKNFRFKGYELVKKETKQVSGKDAKFRLAGGYRATIKDKGRADGKFKLAINVVRMANKKLEKKLATTIAIKPGRSQLLGGWKFEGKDVLILAVSVR